MTATAFGMPLNILRDGAVIKEGGYTRPLPLAGTTISIDIRSGLAVTKLSRRFKNTESEPIEVLMTFPVGFHSAVTGLGATINGRTLVGKAKAIAQARETYESAIERGELAVLHEEPLRGLNVLSIAPLPAGAEVEVHAEIVTPLTLADGHPFLRLPMTIGEVYGESPLMPADDIKTQAGLESFAHLTVTSDGRPTLIGGQVISQEGIKIGLNKAIEILCEGSSFGALTGYGVNGRKVELNLQPLVTTGDALSCAILVDRSGSTESKFSASRETVWEAMCSGLKQAFTNLHDADQIALWEFDTGCRKIGTAQGIRAAALLKQLGKPAGGTELAAAVEAAWRDGARKILVLTDGQTWATRLSGEMKASVHAVIVGEDSLDAGIGHLATITGGEVFYAAGTSTTSAIQSALNCMRRGSTRVQGEIINGQAATLSCIRGGIEIKADWSESPQSETASDAVGRFAAALALPLFEDNAQGAAFASAHDLACHLTSLVLVDPETKSEPGIPRSIRQPLVAHMAMSVSHDMSIDYSAGPVRRTSMARERSCELTTSLNSRVDRSISLSSEFNFEVDWGTYAADFMKGDFENLPENTKEQLEHFLRHPIIKGMAKTIGLDPMLLALALYIFKNKIADRNAKRIVKTIMKQAGEDKFTRLAGMI